MTTITSTPIIQAITIIKPYVKNRDDFYNSQILGTGLSPKQTLDNVIYIGNQPKRGCTYGYFAARAY